MERPSAQKIKILGFVASFIEEEKALSLDEEMGSFSLIDIVKYGTIDDEWDTYGNRTASVS
jgi:hypothetical protein